MTKHVPPVPPANRNRKSGHEHEARGEGHRPRRPRDRDAAFLERLAHRVQHTPLELRHLVQEENAVVREADLSGARM